MANGVVKLAVDRAVYTAIAPHKEPPHPGLALYLRAVP